MLEVHRYGQTYLWCHTINSSPWWEQVVSSTNITDHACSRLCAGGAAVHLGVCRPASVLSPVGTLRGANHRQGAELKILFASVISQDTRSSTLSGWLHPLFILQFAHPVHTPHVKVALIYRQYKCRQCTFLQTD